MSEFSNALSVTSSALQMQSKRLRLISENIANMDTPGFRRKMAEVREIRDGPESISKVELANIQLDRSPLERVFAPEHPMADDSGHYEASNVDLIIEVADAREAQRSYEANLKMFDQTRQMSSALMELLRR